MDVLDLTTGIVGKAVRQHVARRCEHLFRYEQPKDIEFDKRA